MNRRTRSPLSASARVAVLLGALLLLAQPALAGGGCEQDRFAAADRFIKCRHKASRFNDFAKFHKAIGSCLTKYVVAWPKIHAASVLTPTVCANAARFVDNADGTVTDNLTGLQWEKTTDDAGVHDKDNLYKWSATGTLADGTAFTSFLATLNQAGSCFAGQCDWRLPTPAELVSIQVAAYPNCGGFCVDAGVFGPLSLFPSWTALTADSPSFAWNISAVGAELSDSKSVNYAVRAVRGGL